MSPCPLRCQEIWLRLECSFLWGRETALAYDPEVLRSPASSATVSAPGCPCKSPQPKASVDCGFSGGIMTLRSSSSHSCSFHKFPCLFPPTSLPWHQSGIELLASVCLSSLKARLAGGCYTGPIVVSRGSRLTCSVAWF